MGGYHVTETSTGRSGHVPYNQLILLDYPVNPRPRYGYGLRAHPKLAEIINANRSAYAEHLLSFGTYSDSLRAIAVNENEAGPGQPFWRNLWYSGVDAAALYCFMATRNPPRYVEVGSGNSTKFARRAVRDHGLRTRMISIDPEPRADVDALCDEVVRSPLASVDLNAFAELDAGDVLFFDGSHRTLMNSDCTAFFLDVLPALRPGVLVHVHDIYLPLDYPPEWTPRFYSEQYLLAAYLLGGHANFTIALPNAFIDQDAELVQMTMPLWRDLEARGVSRSGNSFWMLTR